MSAGALTTEPCIRARIQEVVSEVVQFREDSSELAYLRERGINPNEFAREAFEANLRRMKAEEKVEQLESMGVDLPRPIVDLIREDRER